MEGDFISILYYLPIFDFNPLPPHGGRLWEIDCSEQCPSISIHSLRMEGDRNRYGHHPTYTTFQSTPSAWRETFQPLNPGCRATAFQSTPSAWRETLSPAPIIRQFVISIHSLRMEGDGAREVNDVMTSISIHSLRMEGDVKNLL